MRVTGRTVLLTKMLKGTCKSALSNRTVVHYSIQNDTTAFHECTGTIVRFDDVDLFQGLPDTSKTMRSALAPVKKWHSDNRRWTKLETPTTWMWWERVVSSLVVGRVRSRCYRQRRSHRRSAVVPAVAAAAETIHRRSCRACCRESRIRTEKSADRIRARNRSGNRADRRRLLRPRRRSSWALSAAWARRNFWRTSRAEIDEDEVAMTLKPASRTASVALRRTETSAHTNSAAA